MKRALKPFDGQVSACYVAGVNRNLNLLLSELLLLRSLAVGF